MIMRLQARFPRGKYARAFQPNSKQPSPAVAMLWIDRFDADPDLHVDADPDPDWHQNDADPHAGSYLEFYTC
jgi:hypothetical protein